MAFAVVRLRSDGTLVAKIEDNPFMWWEIAYAVAAGPGTGLFGSTMARADEGGPIAKS
jgi:hypothetical protein